MENGKRYGDFVCGFALSQDLREVLLIEKNRGPKMNIGKWNGLGGKIEEEDVGSPVYAIVREFGQECGVQTRLMDWHPIHKEKYNESGNTVWYLTARLSLEQQLEARQTESEPVRWVSVEHVLQTPLNTEFAYNLPYLVGMAYSWYAFPSERYTII